MVKNNKQGFLQGALVLTLAAFISKFMGLFYRVLLTRLIGKQGIGLYQMAYPIYTTILVISRSGIPVAISKLVAEKVAEDNQKSAYRIFRVALSISFILGLIFSFGLIVTAKPIAQNILRDPRAFYSVLAIAPAIFFVSIMASYRGFFQGLQTMNPTAISQIVEQLVRMTTMLLLAYLLLSKGIKFASAGAAFGAVTGAIAGLTVLLYIYYKHKNEIDEFALSGPGDKLSISKIISRLASLAFPVTLGALVLPLMQFVDATLIPWRLQVAGFSINEATGLYGDFAGMAMVLVNFPTVLTVSLAASLVPAISEAFALGKDRLIKARTQSALRITIFICLPAAVGLLILATPITDMLFDVPEAGIPLRYVSWGVIFICLQQTSSSILQGIGKTAIPARNLFLGAALNAALNYQLTSIPGIGIRGAAFATASGFCLAAVLNLLAIGRLIGYNYNYQDMLLKPILSVVIMSLAIIPIYNKTISLANHNTVATLTAVFAGALIYGLVLMISGAVKERDIRLIPKVGDKLAVILLRIGLVRG
ncbi:MULTISPECIES: putative polysaccharide biosynthesis protein [unclassified Candidatus Frackibacter]|uniref:putative polysaccharide biosynthesis protein n=1 Tax=unclassified Candidatus Frackibacter TaxID=2648818 RepID=UPI000793316D|nr:MULTISPECIES: polysaccharide biosynthesis protein [unclassified Candidatus Frackibacter]KXS45674.1 MAG: stage V sporulation protein B [Candidatus Frackibacter sp. T328-2]SDC66514.1 stage V sporulation protein B [Candidatus Frackibacter sp. WG11]SEM79692.1 stage V sporulation protein B [Candidatus Frackibacter sp. WG12]SFL90396.1 stage V sporulation protein B [Candidatus Frackibacter sp. WG13]